MSDAHLAALAVEHDCELASNDADFRTLPGAALDQSAGRAVDPDQVDVLPR